MRLLIVSAAIAAVLATTAVAKVHGLHVSPSGSDDKGTAPTKVTVPDIKLNTSRDNAGNDSHGGTFDKEKVGIGMGKGMHNWVKASFDRRANPTIGSTKGDTGFSRDHEVISPRDAASGLPTGKRMHKPFVISQTLDRKRAATNPTTQDHAVNTKGTGAQNGRSAAPGTAANGPPKPVNVTKVRTKSNQANE